jgi:hypothetical protein
MTLETDTSEIEETSSENVTSLLLEQAVKDKRGRANKQINRFFMMPPTFAQLGYHP